MSLSVAVHKDIGEYREKVVGKLSLRTLCCVALGLAYSSHWRQTWARPRRLAAKTTRRHRRAARRKGAELREPSKEAQAG